MSFARLLLFSISACLLGVGCGKEAEAPPAPVAPEALSAKPKPHLPPVTGPVFTLKDFDSNSSDHNATRKAIGAALGKSPSELTQTDLAKVEKLDLFGAGITDISPVAALTGLKRLNIFGNKIYDLTALTGLTLLEVLYASENKIADLTPLAGLTRLRVLHLRKNFCCRPDALGGVDGNVVTGFGTQSGH